MHVLVTGGTGTVGSQVVRELLARNVEVSVLTREASKGATLPAGVQAVVGDLGEAETVRRGSPSCNTASTRSRLAAPASPALTSATSPKPPRSH